MMLRYLNVRTGQAGVPQLQVSNNKGGKGGSPSEQEIQQIDPLNILEWQLQKAPE